MGNICEIISRPFKHEPAVVVGTPILHQTAPVSMSNQYPQVIVQQPVFYHDQGLSMANGFLTGMLIGEILD